MNLSDILRNIFGVDDSRFEGSSRPLDPVPKKDEFRKPIWNLDEEDDDDDDFRTQGNSFSFQVFTNPLEMHRFFENTLGEIVQNFQRHMSETDLGLPPSFDSGFPPLEPSVGTRNKENLRDQFLKPEYRAAARPSLDDDLDARIKSEGLDSVMERPRKNPVFGQSLFSGSSTVSKAVRLPDGSVEMHTTVKDSQGNQEITVTRTVGDQSYSVTTKVDHTGVEQRTENLVNINEGDLSDFNQRWENRNTTPKMPALENEVLKPSRRQDWFPWDKLF